MEHQACSHLRAASGWHPIVIAALVLAIFIADLVTELKIRHLGIVVATSYVVVVLMSARFLRARGIVLVSAGCMGLAVLAYILMPLLLAHFQIFVIYPPISDEAEGIANTGISLAIIGLTTVLVLRNQAAEVILREPAAADALQKAQADLARLNRLLMLGEMTASIAHEIKQPVSAVMTDAAAGLRWLDAQPPELGEVRQSLSRVLMEGNRVGEVIGRVRSLVKSVPPQKDWLDINEAIGEVIALTKAELQRNEVRLKPRLSGDLPFIHGDRVQLQQVIVNLVMNAAEAMSGVSDRPRELTIVSNINDAKDVSVEVQDTGSGLDTANLDQLFRSFYTTKPDGMGMGLSISRTIIEAHGGRISAAPGKPCGAVFAFTLPIEVKSSQYSGPSPGSRPVVKGGRLLTKASRP
jgi:C4-dicarboxylate-specific signal transduction histidine kinase